MNKRHTYKRNEKTRKFQNAISICENEVIGLFTDASDQTCEDVSCLSIDDPKRAASKGDIVNQDHQYHIEREKSMKIHIITDATHDDTIIDENSTLKECSSSTINRASSEDFMNMDQRYLNDLLTLNISHDIPWFEASLASETCNFVKEHQSVECVDISEDYIDWSQVPASLDPAAGELSADRAIRKRQQVASLIEYVEIEMKSMISEESRLNNCIVDFGSGSGHLALLVAHRNPTFKVILVERKEYSVEVAERRMRECSLHNASIYCGDIRKIDQHYSDLHICLGISLHSCGLLTDYAVDLCLKYRAGMVLVPCCYGQIGKPPPDKIFSLDEISERSSDRILTSLRDKDTLQIISSAADTVVGMDGDLLNSSGFLIAKSAMRMIDIDRCLRSIYSLRESQWLSHSDDASVIESCAPERDRRRYICAVKSLRPLSCSPKNNVLIARLIR